MPPKTQIKTAHEAKRISQGDILSEVEYLEGVTEDETGSLQIDIIHFPYVVVLTQDCDLQQDHSYRSCGEPEANQDKFLVSALLAPLYVAEQVRTGDHLTPLSRKCQDMGRPSKTPWQDVTKNLNPRYHYLNLEACELPDLVADFKHYFSATIEYLEGRKADGGFVAAISPLFREDVCQRFAAFLSRIGLPEEG